ncbi:MAG: hypothetical protein FWC06_02725 [Treponema sp.]|nr:hypothetical protein [Treponema sp.]
MNNKDIVFDEKSGISREEQQEILAHINGITEKNRTALSQSPFVPQNEKEDKRGNVKAKKSGAFFPLSVNITALIVLAAGAFLLVHFNGRIDEQARTGGAVYNLTEKALIEEIRKDMTEKLAAKEREISIIISRLEEVDTQLFLMQFDSQNMSLEQLNAQESLLGLQKTYRDDLSILQDERSKILEEYRLREAVLRAQLIERIEEFSASRQRTESELDSAAGRLESLTSEQNSIAAIDAQFAGGFTLIGALIQNRQYSTASHTLENLRYLNNNNAVTLSPSYQTRKELYNQLIGSMNILIDEMQRFQGTDDTGLELIEKNAHLEETVSQMQKIIDALNEGSGGQALLFAEMEETVSSLRETVSTLETNAAERSRRITALETNAAEKDRTIGTLQTNNTEKDRTISTLETNITERNRTISSLETNIAERNRTITALESNATERDRRITALETNNAEKDRTIGTLQANNTEKDRTISTLETNAAERNRTITALETERTALNQTVTSLTTANTAQEREIANLRNQIDIIRQLLME